MQKKGARSITKSVVFDLKLTPEKDILVVTPNTLPFLKYWVNQKGIPHEKYKHEVHRKCMETIEEETTQENVDEDIAEFDALAIPNIADFDTSVVLNIHT